MRTKQAYLTVDDCPGPDFRIKIDYLAGRGIPAILFCEGEKLARRTDDAAYAVGRGFLIGNHGYEHRYFSEMSLEECIDSIRRTDQLIDRIYLECGVARPAKFFRFPYFDQGGDENAAAYEAKNAFPLDERLRFAHPDKRLKIQECLRELGYAQPKFEAIADPDFLRVSQDYDVRCTFDQMEYWLGKHGAPWGLDREEAILHRIDEDVPEAGRGLNRLEFQDVILIHDHENTTGLFFQIVDRYLEKGIQFLKAW